MKEKIEENYCYKCGCYCGCHPCIHTNRRGRPREWMEKRREKALSMREERLTLEEIRVFLGYKTISGVQRILGLHK